MSYYEKYQKYKNKYLKVISQRGGGIEDIYTETFDNNFDDRWVITGSMGVKLYVESLGLIDKYEIKPRDIDIIVVDKIELSPYGLGLFNKLEKDKMATRSATYNYGEKSFDVIVSNSLTKYYEISGVRVLDPEEILQEYEENLESRVKREEDLNKIEALKEIVKMIDKSNIKRLEPVRRVRRDIESESESPVLGRNLFGEESVKDSVGSPPPEIRRVRRSLFDITGSDSVSRRMVFGENDKRENKMSNIFERKSINILGGNNNMKDEENNKVENNKVENNDESKKLMSVNILGESINIPLNPFSLI